jgi:hypothetical protein
MYGGYLGIGLVIFFNVQVFQVPHLENQEVRIPTTLYIYVGDDLHSKNIVHELNYKWNNSSEFLGKIKFIRENLPDKIEVIHWKKLKDLPKIIPSYSYGEYDKAKAFPSQCFEGSCYSLFFIFNLQRERYLSGELSEWEDTVSNIINDSDNEYYAECHTWVLKNFPSAFTTSEYDDCYYLEGILNKYGTYDGFPQRKPFALPIKPEIKQLWEEGFDIEAIERFIK